MSGDGVDTQTQICKGLNVFPNRGAANTQDFAEFFTRMTAAIRQKTYHGVTQTRHVHLRLSTPEKHQFSQAVFAALDHAFDV